MDKKYGLLLEVNSLINKVERSGIRFMESDGELIEVLIKGLTLEGVS